MKNVVIDTSVVIKWFLPEIGAESALKIKDNLLTGKIKISSRDLLLYEFASAFKNYSKIKLEQKDFTIAIKTLTSLKIAIFPINYSELTELFTTAKRLDISIYDCSYLLLAKRLKSPLYTADKKLHLASKKLLTSYFV